MQLASDGALISSRRNLAILKRVDIYYEYPIFISKDQQVAKDISVYGRAIKLNHLCQFFPYSLENLVKNQRNCYNNRKKCQSLNRSNDFDISSSLNNRLQYIFHQDTVTGKFAISCTCLYVIFSCVYRCLKRI